MFFDIITARSLKTSGLSRFSLWPLSSVKFRQVRFLTLDSKHSRVCHDCISVNPLFIGVFVTSVFTFRNLHLAVFSQFRFWLCLYNFIWRRIEVVITGLTRNQLGSNPPRVRISPSPPRTTVILGLRLFSFVMD